MSSASSIDPQLRDAVAATRAWYEQYGLDAKLNGPVDIGFTGAHGSSYNALTDSINISVRHIDSPFELLKTVSHEYTHRIQRQRVGFPGMINDGQAGSVGEAISDAVAAAVLVQAKVAGERAALADLDPTGRTVDSGPHGKVAMPTHISQYRRLWLSDNGGVHVNEGIPRKAATLMAATIGLQRTAELHVDAMPALGHVTDFRGLAKAVSDAAVRRFGADSPDTVAVHQAWKAVGL